MIWNSDNIVFDNDKFSLLVVIWAFTVDAIHQSSSVALRNTNVAIPQTITISKTNIWPGD